MLPDAFEDHPDLARLWIDLLHFQIVVAGVADVDSADANHIHLQSSHCHGHGVHMHERPQTSGTSFVAGVLVVCC